MQFLRNYARESFQHKIKVSFGVRITFEIKRVFQISFVYLVKIGPIFVGLALGAVHKLGLQEEGGR